MRTLAMIECDDKAVVAAMKAAVGNAKLLDESRVAAIEFLERWAGGDKDRRREVVPLLQAGLTTRGQSGLPSRCAEVAGHFGPDAKDLLPAIRNLLASSPLAHVQENARTAITQIEAK